MRSVDSGVVGGGNAGCSTASGVSGNGVGAGGSVV